MSTILSKAEAHALEQQKYARIRSDRELIVFSEPNRKRPDLEISEHALNQYFKEVRPLNETR
jgi:hypothetical protein